MGRKLTQIEKIAIFLISTAATVFVLISLKVWSTDLGNYFFKAGKWHELLMVLALAYIVTNVVQILLRWQAEKLDQFSSHPHSHSAKIIRHNAKAKK